MSTVTITPTESKIAHMYGSGRDIAAIAAQLHMRPDLIGEIISRLCGYDRQRARNVWRTGTAPMTVYAGATPRPYQAATAPRSGPPTGLPVSAREQQLLEFAALGLTNQTIATRVGLTPATVRTVMRRVYRRLGVHDRAAAVAICLDRGIITPSPTAGGAA